MLVPLKSLYPFFRTHFSLWQSVVNHSRKLTPLTFTFIAEGERRFLDLKMRHNLQHCMPPNTFERVFKQATHNEDGNFSEGGVILSASNLVCKRLQYQKYYYMHFASSAWRQSTICGRCRSSKAIEAQKCIFWQMQLQPGSRKSALTI